MVQPRSEAVPASSGGRLRPEQIILETLTSCLHHTTSDHWVFKLVKMVYLYMLKAGKS